MSEERGELSGLVIGLALGAMVGAVLGILFAPGPGTETRGKLREAMEDLPEKAKKVADRVKERFAKKESEEQPPIL